MNATEARIKVHERIAEIERQRREKEAAIRAEQTVKAKRCMTLFDTALAHAIEEASFHFTLTKLEFSDYSLIGRKFGQELRLEECAEWVALVCDEIRRKGFSTKLVYTDDGIGMTSAYELVVSF